jgi:hypothetical protein
MNQIDKKDELYMEEEEMKRNDLMYYINIAITL